LVGFTFFVFARPIVGIFTDDPQVENLGIECMRLVSLGYPFYAWGMVMEQSFNGAGDTATPTWINLFCYWVFQIPLAWTLATRFGLESRGVYLAICIAESVLAIVSVILFRKGRWKQVQV